MQRRVIIEISWRGVWLKLNAWVWEGKAYHMRWYLHQGLKNEAKLIDEEEGKAFKGTMCTKVERCGSMPSKGAGGLMLVAETKVTYGGPVRKEIESRSWWVFVCHVLVSTFLKAIVSHCEVDLRRPSWSELCVRKKLNIVETFWTGVPEWEAGRPVRRSTVV